MAWLKIETAVARNRKFVKAGPAPAWLWLCGLAYCQEGLTDGFIPTEALDFLGVKNAKGMAARLEVAGLWDVVPGGWLIHDYLEHNRPADQIRQSRALRAEGGKLGGRPPKNNLPRNLKVSTTETLPETSGKKPVNPATATTTATDQQQLQHQQDAPVDDDWQRFLDAYPSEGRYPTRMASELFLEARRSGVTLEAMLAALANHSASERWAVAGKIPNVEKWLAEKRWNTTLPAPKVVGLSSRTAGNLAAAQRFVARRQGGDS